jgi:hypothetical protein
MTKLKRKLSQVELFYINQHRSTPPRELAKLIGCSENLIRKTLGVAESRDKDTHDILKTGKAVEEKVPDNVTPVEPVKTNNPGISVVATLRREGGPAATAMTQAGSELGDEIDKLGSTLNKLPQHVYKADPNR